MAARSSEVGGGVKGGGGAWGRDPHLLAPHLLGPTEGTTARMNPKANYRFFFFVVLGFELMASHLLGRSSTT
jgi:hypothetical protein